MNHITFISSLLLIWLIAFVSAKREIVKVLDARGDFVGRTESAEIELNQAVLTEDSKGNLPEKFTICAATFLANWISNFAWFNLLKEDGTHWVFFYQKIKNLDQDSSKLAHSLWMNVNGAYSYLGDFGPFEFNRWVHLCVGFNLDEGVLSVVADGTSLPKKGVVGLRSGRPTNLSRRLILGKSNRGGKWKQDSVLVSSVEVFDGILDRVEMEKKTKGERCGGPGDYLSWIQVTPDISIQTFESYCLDDPQSPIQTFQMVWELQGPGIKWTNTTTNELCRRGAPTRFVSTAKTTMAAGRR